MFRRELGRNEEEEDDKEAVSKLKMMLNKSVEMLTVKYILVTIAD